MLWVGTSGYNYPEWRGSFYPEEFSAAKMLEYYAARFSTVEINYTFYRLPNEKTVKEWAAGTPPGFQFTLKASQRITHKARLQDCEDLVNVFCQRATLLGPKLATVLFQMPPYFRLKLDALETFVGWLPAGLRAAFEFRHQSWLCEEVYNVLRSKNLALCLADNEKATTPQVLTADYTYLRLRDEGYDEAGLAAWATTAREMQKSLKDVYVYFKHEEAGKGPEFARTFLKHAGG